MSIHNDPRFVKYLKIICINCGWVTKDRGKVACYCVPNSQTYDSMVQNFKAMDEQTKNSFKALIVQ